jgi:hypothetical protein
MNLSDISIVFEVDKNASIAGVSRGKILPHDVMNIDGRDYRVAAMFNKSDGVTAFFATVDKAPRACPIDLFALANDAMSHERSELAP